MTIAIAFFLSRGAWQRQTSQHHAMRRGNPLLQVPRQGVVRHRHQILTQLARDLLSGRLVRCGFNLIQHARPDRKHAPLERIAGRRTAELPGDEMGKRLPFHLMRIVSRHDGVAAWAALSNARRTLHDEIMRHAVLSLNRSRERRAAGCCSTS